MSALFRTPLAYAPAPTGRTIDALLQFADVTEDLGQGRICLRMSPKRARSAEVKPPSAPTPSAQPTSP
jgi:hypothetical protein